MPVVEMNTTELEFAIEAVYFYAQELSVPDDKRFLWDLGERLTKIARAECRGLEYREPNDPPAVGDCPNDYAWSERGGQ